VVAGVGGRNVGTNTSVLVDVVVATEDEGGTEDENDENDVEVEVWVDLCLRK
jgi:hypothetical protein